MSHRMGEGTRSLHHSDAEYLGEEWTAEASNSEAAQEALRPVLRAGKLARFRMLTVVCGNGHKLVDVFRTASGPVVVGMGPSTLVKSWRREHSEYALGDPDGPYGESAYTWTESFQTNRRVNRDAPVCCFLDQLKVETTDLMYDGRRVGETRSAYQVVHVQCRCRTAEIAGWWMRDHIAEGRQRVRCDETPGSRLVTLPRASES